jgi:hypothetical protein
VTTTSRSARTTPPPTGTSATGDRTLTSPAARPAGRVCRGGRRHRPGGAVHSASAERGHAQPAASGEDGAPADTGRLEHDQTPHPRLRPQGGRARPLRPQPPPRRRHAPRGLRRADRLTWSAPTTTPSAPRGTGHHAALRQLGNRLVGNRLVGNRLVGILHGCLTTRPATTSPLPGPSTPSPLDTAAHGTSDGSYERCAHVAVEAPDAVILDLSSRGRRQ